MSSHHIRSLLIPCSHLLNIFQDMVVKQEYSGHVVAVENFTRKVSKYGYPNDVLILDIGCGTGLVGEELHKNGYKNIDGVDFSPDMLKLAKEKGIYSSLRQGAVGSPECKDLGIAANQYDVAISVGLFSLKHANSEGFNDLVHVVKPGGLVCFSMRELTFNDSTYQEKMDQLAQEGKWKLILKDYNPSYFSHDGAWCFVYQIL